MNDFEVLHSSLNNDANPAPVGLHKPPLPPHELNEGVGGGDYEAIGLEFFSHFTGIGGLQPHHRVLDIGCGCGRMAVPLIPFLDPHGEYWGFDIVPAAIEWSRQNITAYHPRFHFELADIFNKVYNPSGKSQPAGYHFPYEDDWFDFTFLTSVFTHMLTADLEHYLSEIARTLKQGGRCMMSFFLLNPESLGLIAGGQSQLKFEHPFQEGATFHAELPEAAVAYDEQFIRKSIACHGLEIVEPIHYGSWPGRGNFLSYQDVIVVTKK
jgi:SAM-dependent methyltransferase